MDPKEIVEEIEEAGQFRQQVEADYRQHLNKYAFGLLASELTIVGFLLQHATTSTLLKYNHAKSFLLISLYLSLVSLILNLIHKKLTVIYARGVHYAWQYRARSKDSNLNVSTDGRYLPPDADASDKATKSLRTADKSTIWATRAFKWSEIFFGLASLFAVILVTALLSNIS